MVEGNTPLALYQEISRSQPQLSHLNVFDEYVGVPKEEPRNCANLSRRNMIEPRGNPEAQYHQVRSLKAEAGRSIRQHEMTIRLAGGLDVLVLGKNAHIGFGFCFEGFNKTGEGVVHLSVDDYGNGVVGAYNRKGKGRTLESR